MWKYRSSSLLACALLTACAGVARDARWHLPWRRGAAAPPPLVQELDLGNASEGVAAARVGQYWRGNTLHVDLSALRGPGTLQLARSQTRDWPRRIAFDVAAGSMASMEVQGAQRVMFNMPGSATPGGSPLELALAPDVYPATSAALQLTMK